MNKPHFPTCNATICDRAPITERRVVAQIFCNVWQRIVAERGQTLFDPAWRDGNDFDNAIIGGCAPKLEAGQMIASHTGESDDRHLIIIGTPLGNVVVFERYTAGHFDAFGLNSTKAFHRFIGVHFDRTLTADNMCVLLGNWINWEANDNIGKALSELSETLDSFSIEDATVM